MRLAVCALLLLAACRQPERDCVTAEPEPEKTCPPASSLTCAPAPVVVSSAGPSVPLDLPSASSGEVQIFFAIDMTKDGACYADGTKLASCDDLHGLARIAVAKNPQIRATIRADASVTHGAVIHVIDLLKQAGLNKVAFGVSKP